MTSFLFRGFARREIDNGSEHEKTVWGFNRIQTNLRQETHFRFCAGQIAPARVSLSLACGAVRKLYALMLYSAANRSGRSSPMLLPNQFVASIAEQLFDMRVDEDDFSFLVQKEDAAG